MISRRSPPKPLRLLLVVALVLVVVILVRFIFFLTPSSTARDGAPLALSGGHQWGQEEPPLPESVKEPPGAILDPAVPKR
ncbi:MAG: hypothetical protein HQL57_10395 [Magnetococcales bacterium]|nr:hypothetical protein [Magnetococcales bacterium]